LLIMSGVTAVTVGWVHRMQTEERKVPSRRCLRAACVATLADARLAMSQAMREAVITDKQRLGRGKIDTLPR